MSDPATSLETAGPPAVPTCPICRRDVPAEALAVAAALDAELLGLVAANTPGWSPEQGICPDCAHRFQLAREALRVHSAAVPGSFILPTALRLGALEEFTGRGVTIAFLDSGFYAHPDLVRPEDRIVRYVDVTGRARRRDLRAPDESSWHGMMTSVVACGNGSLSGGLHRGLASDARLVLVKCGSVRRIRHDDLQRGLEWVLRNRERYGIRVVNVSSGGDYEAPYLADGLCQAAENAARAGLFVCASAGNTADPARHPVLPPASAPSVLTVGGLDDQNRLAFAGYGLYHSSYGPTIDGLQKPEVIAPGIWVAAPILPGTPTAARAALLARLANASDAELAAFLRASPGVDPALDETLSRAGGSDPDTLRQAVGMRVIEEGVISAHYKHVDGTSFAAPIVASVAAQMLEANPDLRPWELKRVLIDTARRLPHVPPDRQGWGVIDPRAAVLEALKRRVAGEERRARAGADG